MGMNKEQNSLALLTTANIYPRAVRGFGYVGTTMVALAPAIQKEGWVYMGQPMVVIPLVVGFLMVLMTGLKPEQAKKKL